MILLRFLSAYGAVDVADVLNWFVNERLRMLTCVLKLLRKNVGVFVAV